MTTVQDLTFQITGGLFANLKKINLQVFLYPDIHLKFWTKL